jgi:RimJ/RimL family protein N-acetyltransferase
MTGPAHDDFRRVRSPFEGTLIRLRAVEESDLERIHDLFWDPEVTQHLSVAWPEPLAGTRAWWETARRDPGRALFAIETLAGHLVGACELGEISDRSRHAMLGIWISRDHWNEGLGSDAVRTLCGFGFREMNLHRITLHVYATNPRGIRAYRKVGFREEGRMREDHFVGGRRVDVVVMGLLAADLVEN